MAYRLMIVDDSNIIRNRIERSFANSDIEIVATASNGVEALQKFAEHKPDLVTMDLTMPEMDGLECIQKIIGQGTGVSILVVSALSDKATALQALQYGARGFICKPFSEEDLFSAIQRLIEMQSRAKV
ncbi:response regulator receiver domain-containing protein [Moraxella macacae 0408225]|uniref:Response regulator receiver domain-containing protein n=1 Tax=Moraxella macacae 0408225 TaxID=1230338 RepID=L2FA55_9GAMM|nr:response regulator [Moraxella macacae]ELA09353.1 response regulator receiver domain-containing protein [Moraxella macacae 0408225]